jgi:hypothetical protein
LDCASTAMNTVQMFFAMTEDKRNERTSKNLFIYLH